MAAAGTGLAAALLTMRSTMLYIGGEIEDASRSQSCDLAPRPVDLWPYKVGLKEYVAAIERRFG